MTCQLFKQVFLVTITVVVSMTCLVTPATGEASASYGVVNYASTRVEASQIESSNGEPQEAELQPEELQTEELQTKEVQQAFEFPEKIKLGEKDNGREHNHDEIYRPTYVDELRGMSEAFPMESTQKGASCENNTETPVDLKEIITYQVQRGDTLTGLARRFETGVSTLVELNQMHNPHALATGEEIEIIEASGIIHQVKAGSATSADGDPEGDSLPSWEEITELYEVSLDKIKRLDPQDTAAPQEGERLLIKVEPESCQHEFPNLSRSSEDSASPSFQWPLEGTITSPYGMRSSGFHHGIDIAAALGTPIEAAAGGKITYAAYKGNYGLLVEIDHPGSWKTRYGHNQEVTVQRGDRVDAGETISKVGVTGNATGPHVHFEIWQDGERKNPQDFLP